MVGSYISRLLRSRVPAGRRSDNSFDPRSPCAFPWLRPRRAHHEHQLSWLDAVIANSGGHPPLARFRGESPEQAAEVNTAIRDTTTSKIRFM